MWQVQMVVMLIIWCEIFLHLLLLTNVKFIELIVYFWVEQVMQHRGQLIMQHLLMEVDFLLALHLHKCDVLHGIILQHQLQTMCHCILGLVIWHIIILIPVLRLHLLLTFHFLKVHMVFLFECSFHYNKPVRNGYLQQVYLLCFQIILVENMSDEML